MPCAHFFNSIPRLIASTVNYLNAPKCSSTLFAQLSLLSKIGTYDYQGKWQSVYGLRVNIRVSTKSEYAGHEIFAPTLHSNIHFWELLDGKVLENISKFPIFDNLFNAPSETLQSLFGTSFMKRHANWIKNRFKSPESFSILVNDLHIALNLSTMERAQFLKLVSLIILLLDAENILLEMEQTSMGGILNPKGHNDRIRKYILSLPATVLDEICSLFGPSTDKYTLVTKVEQISKTSGQSRFFCSLAQYVHRALFNWALSKMKTMGRSFTDEHSFNFVWLPQSYQFLETNVAVEHLHAWAVRYLCESEEVGMKSEGFSDYTCNVWKTHGCSCQIVEQFMNGHLDVKSLSQRFTINHSFGSVLYATSNQKKFNAEALVQKLRELLPLKLLTSTPHFCHVMFLDHSPLESTEMLQNEISKSFLKMVCDVDDASYPHKIALDKFRLSYLPKLLFISRRKLSSLENILKQYVPKEEFLIGTHSVLLKNSGYIFLEKLISKAKKSAVGVIERAFYRYKVRRNLLKGLKEFLRQSGRSVDMEKIYAAQRIKNWWKRINHRRQVRKWAVLTIENYWIMSIARRQIRACVVTIEEWWLRVKEKRSKRLYWLDMAVRIIQKNMRIYVFKQKLARRIIEKKNQIELSRRKRLENMEKYEQQWRESPTFKDNTGVCSSTGNRAHNIRSLRPPEKLLQLMDSPRVREYPDFSTNDFSNSESTGRRLSSQVAPSDFGHPIYADPDIPKLTTATQDQFGNLIIPKSIVDEFLRTSKRDRNLQQLEWRSYVSPKKASYSPDVLSASPIFSSPTNNYKINGSGNSRNSIKQPRTHHMTIPKSLSNRVSSQVRGSMPCEERYDSQECSPDYSFESTRTAEKSDQYSESELERQYSDETINVDKFMSSPPSSEKKQEDRTVSSNYASLLDQVFNGGKEPKVSQTKSTTTTKSSTARVMEEIKNRSEISQMADRNYKTPQNSKKFTSSSSSALFMRVYGYSPDTGVLPEVPKSNSGSRTKLNPTPEPQRKLPNRNTIKSQPRVLQKPALKNPKTPITNHSTSKTVLSSRENSVLSSSSKPPIRKKNSISNVKKRNALSRT